MIRSILPLAVAAGIVIVASDAHYRPDEPPSTAHRALVELVSHFAEEGTLSAVILKGDVADFPKVSKHARIMWETQPTVADEFTVVRRPISEIAEIAGCATTLALTMGNHDARLDTFLSQRAAACESVPGFTLRDHIEPDWAMAWAAEINGSGPDSVLINHRHRSGVGAPKANVAAAGRSIVTGHTHQQGLARLSQGEGHRWGVDAGCLASLSSRAFAGYTEMAAAAGLSNWASGFAVLTFENGRLLMPELVLVTDETEGTFSWRGKLHQAKVEAADA